MERPIVISLEAARAAVRALSADAATYAQRAREHAPMVEAGIDSGRRMRNALREAERLYKLAMSIDCAMLASSVLDMGEDDQHFSDREAAEAAREARKDWAGHEHVAGNDDESIVQCQCGAVAFAADIEEYGVETGFDHKEGCPTLASIRENDQ